MAEEGEVGVGEVDFGDGAESAQEGGEGRGEVEGVVGGGAGQAEVELEDDFAEHGLGVSEELWVEADAELTLDHEAEELVLLLILIR